MKLHFICHVSQTQFSLSPKLELWPWWKCFQVCFYSKFKTLTFKFFLGMILNFDRKLTGNEISEEPFPKQNRFVPYVFYRIIKSTFWNLMKFFRIETFLKFSILQHLFQLCTILYPWRLLRVNRNLIRFGVKQASTDWLSSIVKNPCTRSSQNYNLDIVCESVQEWDGRS